MIHNGVSMLSSLFTLILAASDTGGLLSNQAVIAGMAIAGTILVMRATRKNWTRSKQSAQQSLEPTRERFAKLKVEKAATRELEDAMYELDQLSRQVHGRLDTKFAKLEMVIRDADERIDKLSRLVRSAAGTQTLDVTLVEEDPHVTVPRDATHTPSPLSREGNRGAMVVTRSMWIRPPRIERHRANRKRSKTLRRMTLRRMTLRRMTLRRMTLTRTSNCSASTQAVYRLSRSPSESVVPQAKWS